ncbi:beta-galactosidase 17 isoform X1 [Pistacia vera]|uniref:beta-galactosidase 17 isoform X1 n=1 Tax=Pistacia vera TaxID=55513 RepID=UPI001263450B|nr:beta-galactosidase 17 isoform X1 [Pistacia vera]
MADTATESTKGKTKFSAMSGMRRRSSKTTAFFSVLLFLVLLGGLVPVFAPLPSLSPLHHQLRHKSMNERKFEVAEDMFWKDGKPFQIIGGDVHYFRVLPEYWEDRLLRAKALGLNTIQIYVPWNLHEPKPGKLVFEGIADLVSFLELCQKLDLLVMLRAGPYICAEWDLGGFPAWLLAIKPALKLRSSDPAYLRLVERWWGVLLPKIAPLLYDNGGSIIMVQIENEFGSYGDDKAYLHHLVTLARAHLGEEIVLYTTDGGRRENLQKGTISGDAVFSAVDFSTGDEPWPIFKLQKEFNAPGKSPPLSSEFYTGWLTHWGEKIAATSADSTASYLEKILSKNGSAVLYVAHGGTNFGFYNGANTGVDDSDYKPDLTSYDYDAPIKESGDVDNAKFKAIRGVVEKYSATSLPSIPPDNAKAGYGPIQLQKTALLFDLLDTIDPADVVQSENPISMESVGQMFGFLLYVSEYVGKNRGSSLRIPKVHDRAQVLISCPSGDNGGKPEYVGTIERWSNQALGLPNARCVSNISLYILVENMGRVNYGQYLFDEKGILSSVYLDGKVLHGWKMYSIPFHNLNEVPKINPIIQVASSGSIQQSARKKLEHKHGTISKEPAFFAGRFSIDKVNQVKDTYISFSGWGKGIAFVNEFNIGRYWPSFGPQCNLYVPAPILHDGENVVVIFELESPNSELVVHSVDKPDFMCGSSRSTCTQALSLPARLNIQHLVPS